VKEEEEKQEKREKLKLEGKKNCISGKIISKSVEEKILA
jgi:hypothetical protein